MSAALVLLVSISLLARREPEVRYEARVTTYGCNSSSAVAELEKVRPDPKAFQKRLLEQIAYGQCIGIGKGTVVVGAVEEGEPSILRIEARNSPPGYMAPLSDFRPR